MSAFAGDTGQEVGLLHGLTLCKSGLFSWLSGVTESGRVFFASFLLRSKEMKIN